jgi:hypothetical protein
MVHQNHKSFPHMHPATIVLTNEHFLLFTVDDRLVHSFAVGLFVLRLKNLTRFHLQIYKHARQHIVSIYVCPGLEPCEFHQIILQAPHRERY